MAKLFLLLFILIFQSLAMAARATGPLAWSDLIRYRSAASACIDGLDSYCDKIPGIRNIDRLHHFFYHHPEEMHAMRVLLVRTMFAPGFDSKSLNNIYFDYIHNWSMNYRKIDGAVQKENYLNLVSALFWIAPNDQVDNLAKSFMNEPADLAGFLYDKLYFALSPADRKLLKKGFLTDWAGVIAQHRKDAAGNLTAILDRMRLLAPKEEAIVVAPSEKVHKNASKPVYASNGIQTSIQMASLAFELPEEFFQCSFTVESNYNPDALSPAGARGVTQLMQTAFTDILKIIGNQMSTVESAEVARGWAQYKTRVHKAGLQMTSEDEDFEVVAVDPVFSVGAGALWNRFYYLRLFGKAEPTIDNLSILAGAYNMGINGLNKVCQDPSDYQDCRAQVCASGPQETCNHISKVRACLKGVGR